MSKLNFSILLFLSIFLFSCSDSDNETPENEKTTYKVRYEGSCKTPNSKIRVLYTVKNAKLESMEDDVIEEFHTSSFSKELIMQKGDYCYLSVSADYRNEEEFDANLEYTSKIYVDGKEKVSTSNKASAISYFLLYNFE